MLLDDFPICHHEIINWCSQLSHLKLHIKVQVCQVWFGCVPGCSWVHKYYCDYLNSFLIFFSFFSFYYFFFSSSHDDVILHMYLVLPPSLWLHITSTCNTLPQPQRMTHTTQQAKQAMVAIGPLVNAGQTWFETHHVWTTGKFFCFVFILLFFYN